jgi:hypothetical protein
MKAEIQAAWDATCGSIEAAIGMALTMGIGKIRGRSALESKREFWIELAKAAYEGGYQRGYVEAREKYDHDS